MEGKKIAWKLPTSNFVPVLAETRPVAVLSPALLSLSSPQPSVLGAEVSQSMSASVYGGLDDSPPPAAAVSVSSYESSSPALSVMSPPTAYSNSTYVNDDTTTNNNNNNKGSLVTTTASNDSTSQLDFAGSVYEALNDSLAEAGGNSVRAYVASQAADTMRGSYENPEEPSPFTQDVVASAPGTGPRIGCPVDWNAQFQATLDLPEKSEEDRLHKYERLSSLAHDFVDTAQRIGTIIISEAFLPNASKTILPVNIGGEAGGEKWVSMGILFKFAVDWKHFYGSDARAMKSAGHELKSLMRFYLCEGIRVPLMALIDYRGFRLVAQTILPIDDHTLIYGSKDAGRTVHNSNREFEAKMQLAARRLNIKGHICGRPNPTTGRSPSVFLYGPTDIEGHMGRDGRHYVIDLARVFPPTCEDGTVKETFLYKLMRPEWVAENPVPLSSDAFSGFSSFRMDSVENREVFESTQRLLTIRVPEFARWLDEKLSSGSGQVKAMRDQLTEHLHRQGINCRYFGLVRSHCAYAASRDLVLVEIVARVVKNIMRDRLRMLARSLRVPGDMPYRKEIVNVLNMMLGQSEESEKFWRTDLLLQAEAQFRGAFTTAERDPSYDWLSCLAPFMYRLMKRLQRLAGIKLSKQSLLELKANARHFRVVLPDIERVASQVSHMNIVSFAEGMSLYLSSKMEQGPGGRRLFRLAESKFDGAVRSTPDDIDTLNKFADVLRDHAARSAEEDSLAHYSKALEKYRMGRNWSAIASLGHHLVDVHKRHWKYHDQLLDLASHCFESLVLIHGTPGEIGRRALGRVMVTRAANVNDAQLYEEAGRMFHQDLEGLGLPREDLQWAKELAPVELASLAEVLSRSGALTDFDARWLMNPALYLTSTLLSRLWFCARSLSSVVLAFPKQVAIRSYDEEVNKPIVLAHNSGGDMLVDSFFDPILSVCASSGYVPSALRKLSVVRQPAVSDATLAALVRCCGGVLESLSLDGCDDAGLLTYTAIGECCNSLQELDLSGTLQRLPRKDCFPSAWLGKSCARLKSLSLASTSWPSEHYAEVLRSGCLERTLEHLNLSSCSDLEAVAALFASLSVASPLLSLNLSGSFRLSEKDLFLILNSKCTPSLTSLDISSVPLARDDAVTAFLLAGGDGKKAKGSWRANALKNLNVSRCFGITDASLSLLWQGFAELEQLQVQGCFVSADVVANVIPHCFDRLSVLDVTDFRSGKADDVLTALGNHGCPTLVVLRLGQTAGYNETLSEQGVANCFGKGACPNLQELVVARCREVSDTCLELITKACPSLDILDVSYCNYVTRVGIGHVSANCHQMRELRLAFCRVVGDIQSVAQGLPSLQILDLHECTYISDTALLAIVSSIRTLTFLDIVGCRKVTDACLRAIQRHCPRLTVLSLGGANKFSDPSLLELRAARPSLCVHLYGASEEYVRDLELKRMNSDAAGLTRSNSERQISPGRSSSGGVKGSYSSALLKSPASPATTSPSPNVTPTRSASFKRSGSGSVRRDGGGGGGGSGGGSGRRRNDNRNHNYNNNNNNNNSYGGGRGRKSSTGGGGGGGGGGGSNKK